MQIEMEYVIKLQKRIIKDPNQLIMDAILQDMKIKTTLKIQFN